MTTFVGKYLNPGEVENLIKNEKDGRRKMRLNQVFANEELKILIGKNLYMVRQQARINASKIAAAVKRERKKQLYILASSLKAEWLKSKNEQVEELGQLYGESLNLVGTAHSEVFKEAIYKETCAIKLDEDDLKAAARGEAAFNEMQIKKLKEQEIIKKHEDLRKNVRTVENDRARQISALPIPPSSQMVLTNKVSILPGDKQSLGGLRLPSQKADSTSSTGDLVKVIKENSNDKQIDAHSAAKLEAAKQTEIIKKKRLEKVKQSEKEHIRFLNAKSQLELQQDFNRIMNELEELSKQEQACSEPHLLIELQHNNEQLKQEQEAVVEELFSRLKQPVFKDLDYSSIIQSSTETQKSETSENDVTPVVHIVAQNLITTEASNSSSQTLSSSHQDSPTVTNLYPMDTEANSSDTARKANRWSLEDGSVDKLSISEAIKTDETILAGHFHDHTVDSTANIPVLSSSDFDSSHSPVSLPIHTTSHPDVYKIRKNGHECFTEEMDSSIQSLQPNISASKNKFPLKQYSNLGNQNSKLIQFSRPLSEDDKPRQVNNNFKMLAVTSALASKEKPINSGETTDFTKEFFNVEVRHAFRSDYYEHPSISKETFGTSSVLHDSKDLLNPAISALPTNSHLTEKLALHSDDGSQKSRKLVGSNSQTSCTTSKLWTLPSISRFQANSNFTIPIKNVVESPIQALIPDALSTDMHLEEQHNLYTSVDKFQPGKYQLIAHDLSTIVELDTPNSSVQTCWLDSTTDIRGITDEPNLTLVSSSCSTCSPDQSCFFDPNHVNSTTSTFERELNVMDGKHREVTKVESPFLPSSTKFPHKSSKSKDLSEISIKGNFPLLHKLSFIVRDVSSDESPPFTSYETSGSKSTPTLSSGESHSCFSGGSQKSFALPSLSSSSLEFLSGNPYSFLVQNPSLSKFSSQIEVTGEDAILSKPTLSTFDFSASILPSSMATESLSFIDCAHLATIDKCHSSADSLTGESTLDAISSKINNTNLSSRWNYFSNPNESMSDSMFSFLKHELSASGDDSSLSLIGTSTSSSH